MLRRDLSAAIFASAAGSVVLSKQAEAQTCTQPCYPQTAAEAAAGVTPVNYNYPCGVVDRYATNTTPGTTNMSPGWQAAINVALASSVAGQGQSGYAIRGLASAYSIQTPLTFGGSSAALLPLDIGGQGPGTQLINNLTMNSGPIFDMNGKNGWYVHDLLICGNSTHKNDGIHAGHVGGSEQVLWRIERVMAFMAGVGFYVADTNGGVINACRSWPDNPPGPPLVVAQAVTTSDVSHHIHLTGSFVNNLSIYDCILLPNENFAAGTCGIKMDCTSSTGIVIVGGDVESASGANNETGINLAPSGSLTAAFISGVYHEGTILSFTNMTNSEVHSTTDGGSAGTILLNSACRTNSFTAVNAQTINQSSNLNYGNTWINCLCRTSTGWTDNSTSPTDRRINCILGGMLIRDWGGTDPVSVTVAGAQTPNCYTSASYRYVIGAGSPAFAVNAPLHPQVGFALKIYIINASGGAGVSTTFNSVYRMPSNTPTVPANGEERLYMFEYDSVNWILMYSPSVDIPD